AGPRGGWGPGRSPPPPPGRFRSISPVSRRGPGPVGGAAPGRPPAGPPPVDSGRPGGARRERRPAEPWTSRDGNAMRIELLTVGDELLLGDTVKIGRASGRERRT